MGQSTTKPRKKRANDTSSKKSNEEKKVEAITENKSAARSTTELLQEFNEQREHLVAALKTITSTAIQPNGIFPAEIVDMILKNVDESGAQFEIASCCKLWLNVTLSKSYDWFLRRRFVRSNIENGLFWPTLLMHQCKDRNANYEFSCDWALKNNNTLILRKQFYYNRQEGEDKKIGFTKTISFNLSTNKEIEVENSFYEELFAISQKNNNPKLCISTKQNLKAVCGDQSTIIISTVEDKSIKIIDIAKATHIPLKSNEFVKVVSVAFDEKKLVAVSHGYRWREGQSFMSLLEVSDVLISIFDLTDNYRHLKTIKTNLNCDPSISACPVYILLPASGKILINAKDAGLLEINFLHPNLMKNTIKVAQCSRAGGKGIIQTVPTLDLTEYLLQQFRKQSPLFTLGSISTTTYFLQDPNQHKLRTILDSSMNIYDDIFDVTRSQTKRITFIYLVNMASVLKNQDSTFDWMNKEEFDRHWEIRQDYFSTLHLTTLDLSKCHQAHTPRFLPIHMMGDVFFMLFEEFDSQTNQWLITEPFVPHGTNLEFSDK